MDSTYLWNKRLTHIPKALANNTQVAVAKAKSAILTDVNGKHYIDFAGGIGAMNVGHNHPKVVEAICQQAQNYIQPCFHIMVHEPYIKLAEKLNHLTPGDFEKQTMLCNSGAEAVENAIKIARFATKKSAIICFNGAFHGRTYMGLSLTSKVKPYKQGFGSLANDIYRISYPSIHQSLSDFKNNWQTLINNQVAIEDIAAIIIEPQLGEGGFIPANIESMQYIRQLCNQHGIIMIADEIQTGFCRTGKLFAMEHFHVTPDIMITGKSLAAGMPLSAITMKKSLTDSMPVASLGGTNSGNPLACAAALASIEIFETENLAQKAQTIGQKVKDFFQKQKEKHHFIGEIRGLGAMVGVSFVDQNGRPNPNLLKKLTTNALDKGLILLSCGQDKNILRTLMPLTIEEDQLQQAFNILEEAMAECALHINHATS
ncbi:aspartate aminotransferase family protein [Facilibium subflavum]|uniref:aspartate aminotransferase family protein n=1 Tax=Facilibium subflavum TaxID=2219058 RepID=UPI000E652F78|nr:aminotransferase class III-fold pyridoxal phosphate-dependent enzyme [Facilibium subflavum]